MQLGYGLDRRKSMDFFDVCRYSVRGFTTGDRVHPWSVVVTVHDLLSLRPRRRPFSSTNQVTGSGGEAPCHLLVRASVPQQLNADVASTDDLRQRLSINDQFIPTLGGNAIDVRHSKRDRRVHNNWREFAKRYPSSSGLTVELDASYEALRDIGQHDLLTGSHDDRERRRKALTCMFGVGDTGLEPMTSTV